MTRKNLTLAGLTSLAGMAALATTLSLSGCKDDPVTTQPQTVTVKLEDGEIDMTHTLKAGKTIFKVTNAGTMVHQFEVERESDGSEVETNPLQPGASQDLEVTLTAGEYEFYCPQSPDSTHKNHGEKLEFDVAP